ncbi:hypothetical protein [Cryobacterium sp. MLB-32]|uniref:hypothetical protein n=1 Tax=Cryobacterium sp. MLB-32 TaxID=1529318 RepID=UPI000AB1A295|nr:hypothetical protein [Cryobacterium sp. MLB-32]
MTTTPNVKAFTRINARFTGLSRLVTGDFITGDSLAIISTVDADDAYTEVRRVKLDDIATDHGDFDSFRDEVVGALGHIADEIAATAGLTITGHTGHDEVFWTAA